MGIYQEYQPNFITVHTVVHLDLIQFTLVRTLIACKYSRFSLLLTPRDVLPGRTSGPQ